MNHSTSLQEPAPPLAPILCLAGGFTGVILSYGVLSGNAQGQVNFLFLLLLFVFLPVLTLVMTVVFLFRPGGRGIAGWLLELPVWSAGRRAALMPVLSQPGRKAWLVYQAQFFNLGFSLGCLLLYLLLLLATDISFVWRSTLLQAEQLLPLLDRLAWPWWFWDGAQASLALLEQTRDFRLSAGDGGAAQVGLWWRYILAAQIVYSLLPRTATLLLARRQFGLSLREAEGPSPAEQKGRPPTPRLELSDLVDGVGSPFVLLDWAGMPGDCVPALQRALGDAAATEAVNPHTQAAALAGLLDDRAAVVLVKSWEPPMGELADLLKSLPGSGARLLLPLDWQDRVLRPVHKPHLDEWRRFAASLGDWRVLRLKEST